MSGWVSEWVVYWFVFYSSPNHYDILVSVKYHHIYVYKETFPVKMHKFWLKFHSNLIWAYNQHVVDVGWFNVFVPNRHQENIWTWSHVYSPRHGIRVKSGVHSCMKVTTAFLSHYSNVTMSAMASEITGISIAYTTVCSGTDEKEYQSFTSLNSLHKEPVTRKTFPFDDVIMQSPKWHFCDGLGTRV